LSKSILIVTSSYDKTVDYIIEKFPSYNFIRLNVDELHKYKISAHTINGKYKVKFETKNMLIEDLLKEIYSIYFRKIFFPSLDDYDKKYRNFMQKEIYGFIVGLIDSFEGRVLTKPHILRKVENKVYQLFLAKKLDFNIPTSIIGNDANLIEEERMNNTWIAKPLTTGKLHDNAIVQTNIVKSLVNNLELSPTYFQKYIKKEYELRITVINDIFYTVKIEASDVVDWRRNERKNNYKLIDIPSVVKDECRRFMHACQLKFGCFDYIVKDGYHYFLECNPNGQWGWLEKELNLDISDKIMEYLHG